MFLATQDRASTASLAHLHQSHDCGGVGAPCELAGRTYSALIPKGEGPFPAVLFFHGSRGTGQHTIQLPDLVRPFLERGYAVVAPTALDINYVNGPGTGWVWNAARDGRDDFGFARDVVQDATQRFPLDPDRILVAGHSRGGSFAWYLACSEVDPRLTSFAPINGTPVRTRLGPCLTSGLNFDMLYAHGYADTVIPFAGSGQTPGWPGYLGAMEIVEGLALGQKCETSRMTEMEMYDQRNWNGCSNDARVSLIGFRGGHAIPIGWPDLILDWFENKKLSE